MLFRLSPLLLCIIYAQGQDYLGFYPEGLFGDYDGSNNPSFTEDLSKGYGGWDVQDNDDFEKSRGRRYSGLEGDAVEAAISLDEIVPDQDDQLYSQFLNQESPDEDSVAAAAAENWEQDAASEVTQSNDLENKAEEKKEDVGEKKEGLVEDDKGAKKEDEDGERSKRLTESFWSSELADQDLSNFGLDSLFRKKRSAAFNGGRPHRFAGNRASKRSYRNIPSRRSSEQSRQVYGNANRKNVANRKSEGFRKPGGAHTFNQYARLQRSHN